MNVVIIDSGLSELENDLFVDHVQGITIEKNDSGFVYSMNYQDNCGHGTIVTNILVNHISSNINLYIINIFKDELSVDVDLLVEALEYCSTIKCDLIQISLGTLYSDKNLYRIIKKITDNGTAIVAAFDNDKSISYPAAYEEVIGVDVSSRYKTIESYSTNDNNIIDVVGADIYHRSLGINQKRLIVKGSSFYTSYISAQIINLNPRKMDKPNIINELNKRARICFSSSRLPKVKMQIKHAVVFPFNKEIHSMAAFENLLNFTVDGFYDVRQRGNTSRHICDVLPYTDNQKIIFDYDKLNWELSFDTFICGHISELEQILKKRHYAGNNRELYYSWQTIVLFR